MWFDYRGIVPDILTNFGYRWQIPKIIAEAHRQEQAQLQKQDGIEKIVKVDIPIGDSGFGIGFRTKYVGSKAQTLELSLMHPKIDTLYLVAPKTAFSNERMRELYDGAINQIVKTIRSIRKTMPTSQAADALHNPH